MFASDDEDDNDVDEAPTKKVKKTVTNRQKIDKKPTKKRTKNLPSLFPSSSLPSNPFLACILLLYYSLFIRNISRRRRPLPKLSFAKMNQMNPWIFSVPIFLNMSLVSVWLFMHQVHISKE